MEQRSEEPVSGITLFRIAGIPIRLDYSWFLIFALVFVTVSVGYFPEAEPGASTVSHWVAGFFAAILLFASILAHELAHSWMALRAGIAVPEIRLFLFGGVSRMASEPLTPQIELRVAIVGPLMSFFLALAAWFLMEVTEGGPWLASSIFGYLALINVALGIFNLLPGYPLDGGRVLRAIVWWKTGSLRKATKIASDAGQAFAIALMLLGGLQIFAGNLIGGLWIIFVAILLRTMARRGYEDLVLRRALSDADVSDVMVPRDKLVTVAPDVHLDELVQDYFLGHGYRRFPVTTNGDVLGIVSADDVRSVGASERATTTVRDVMAPADEGRRIAPDDSLLHAMERLSKDRRGLLVMRDAELLGLVSSTNLSRFVELRSLEREAREDR